MYTTVSSTIQRKELLAEGEDFDGHSDTEVVLKSYIHWGSGCLSRFNGIFAFAVWEKKSRHLFLHGIVWE